MQQEDVKQKNDLTITVDKGKLTDIIVNIQYSGNMVICGLSLHFSNQWLISSHGINECFLFN